MASNRTLDDNLAGCQIVASCDSGTGVTIINEDALNLTEDELVEVSYITVSEETMINELETLEIITNDDDGSRQSWIQEDDYGSEELYEDEEEEEILENQEKEFTVDKVQCAVADDYLSGKITFHEFITKVDGTEETEQDEEMSSDVEDDLAEEGPNEEDPDYMPDEEMSDVQSRKKHIADTFKSTSSSPTKSKSNRGKKSGVRCTRKLPANLRGTIIFCCLNLLFCLYYQHLFVSFAALMGEANLRFVRKEKQDAINLCMAVIRQVRFLN